MKRFFSILRPVLLLMALIGVALLLFGLQVAQAAQCRPLSEVCVEPGGTRNINGQSIYRDCWRYRRTYECVAPNAVDNCAAVRAKPTCVQINSQCAAAAFNGQCLNYNNTLSCDVDYGNIPNTTKLPPAFRITNENVDESKCTALKNNTACTFKQRVCTTPDAQKTRVINGMSITRDCWEWQDEYSCSQGTASNYCQPLIDLGCKIVSNSEQCLEPGDYGSCKRYKLQYVCTNQSGSVSGPTINLNNTTYTLVQDLPDAQPCQSMANNPRCEKAGSVCVEPGGMRVINGLAVTKDCWKYEDTYTCAVAKNDCEALQTNPACTLSGQSCADQNADGTCALTEFKYRCQTGSSPSTEVTNCSNRTWCVNGQCFDNSNTPDADFGQSTSYLEMLRQMAGYAGNGADGLSFFSGKNQKCGKNPINSCCKTNNKGAGMSNGLMTQQLLSSGIEAAGSFVGSFYVYDLLEDSESSLLSGAFNYATNPDAIIGFDPSNFTAFSAYGLSFNPFAGAGNYFTFDPYSFSFQIGMLILQELSKCDQSEYTLQMQRGQKLCTYAGTYCSQKVLGACVARKESYCCYNSRLARIVSEQGRAQLGKGYGRPEAPNCGGFTQAEFESLDFSKMDLSEFVDEIKAQTHLPDPGQITNNAQTDIQQKVDDYFKK